MNELNSYAIGVERLNIRVEPSPKIGEPRCIQTLSYVPLAAISVSLPAAKEEYERLKTESDAHILALERRNLVDRETVKSVMFQRIRDAKQAILEQTTQLMDDTTKTVIVTNDQLVTELSYQSKQAERLSRANVALQEQQTLLKRQLALVSSENKELFARIHTLVTALRTEKERNGNSSRRPFVAEPTATFSSGSAHRRPSVTGAGGSRTTAGKKAGASTPARRGSLSGSSSTIAKPHALAGGDSAPSETELLANERAVSRAALAMLAEMEAQRKAYGRLMDAGTRALLRACADISGELLTYAAENSADVNVAAAVGAGIPMASAASIGGGSDCDGCGSGAHGSVGEAHASSAPTSAGYHNAAIGATDASGAPSSSSVAAAMCRSSLHDGQGHMSKVDSIIEMFLLPDRQQQGELQEGEKQEEGAQPLERQQASGPAAIGYATSPAEATSTTADTAARPAAAPAAVRRSTTLLAADQERTARLMQVGRELNADLAAAGLLSGGDGEGTNDVREGCNDGLTSVAESMTLTSAELEARALGDAKRRRQSELLGASPESLAFGPSVGTGGSGSGGGGGSAGTLGCRGMVGDDGVMTPHDPIASLHKAAPLLRKLLHGLVQHRKLLDKAALTQAPVTVEQLRDRLPFPVPSPSSAGNHSSRGSSSGASSTNRVRAGGQSLTRVSSLLLHSTGSTGSGTHSAGGGAAAAAPLPHELVNALIDEAALRRDSMYAALTDPACVSSGSSGSSTTAQSLDAGPSVGCAPHNSFLHADA